MVGFCRVVQRRSRAGQAIVIGALAMVVIAGMAGLAIDAGHLYLVRRQAQNAVDMAAFAAGKQLAAAPAQLTSPPHSGDPALLAAHDFAALNGFPTIYSTGCDSTSSSSFTAAWFDSPGYACNATAGFTTKVTVAVPPVVVNNLPVPITCTGVNLFSCFQVTISQQVAPFFGGAIGLGSTYVVTQAVVYTQPSVNGGGYTLPSPVADYLYEPSSAFNEAAAPTATSPMCCNRPTFWVKNADPSINGTDGSESIPVAGDTTTVVSNGDMVLYDTAAFCDPYDEATCGSNAVGADGFSLAPGAKLYCGDGPAPTYFASGASNGLTPCTPTAPAPTGWSSCGPPSTDCPLDDIAGNEASFVAPLPWSPTVSTAGLPACGSLILNGDTVANSFVAGSPPTPVSGNPSCYSGADPYQVQEGIYQYIVVNHGTYEFNSGLYDITGSAPVDTYDLGDMSYTHSPGANGIDHGRESSPTPMAKNDQSDKDFDLCDGGHPNSCPNLSAGVWIGRGQGWNGPSGADTTGCGGGIGGGGTSGGGGDQTVISGSAVTFRFESTAGGFVSTNEVQTISLSAPGVGANMAEDNGAPLLFDLENSSFIHLDAGSPGAGTVSKFSGLVYQTATATAGGVELNPGLGGKSSPALDGQVWAYALTIYGTDGVAQDFQDDYGGLAQPPLGGGAGGRMESSIVSSTTLTQAKDGSGNPINGMETVTISYTDEWAMDAYDAYVKVNTSRPVYFSSGIWNPIPSAGASLPPAGNNPGDAVPAYPSPPPPGGSGYSAAVDPITHQSTDWTLTLPNSSGPASTFEVYGNWTWGHEHDIAGAASGSNIAKILYTFPTPAGSNVAITIYLSDGDRCGDYYLVTASFSNVGQPGAGSQSAGSVVMAR